jgi:hypothetical protein
MTDNGNACRRSGFDARSTAARAETDLQLDSPIPPLVRGAIGLAARDELAFSMACQLFVEDMSGLFREEGVPAARLEHAVARATLDAWRRGQGSSEGVGSAYAAVGDSVTRAKADMSGRKESSCALSVSENCTCSEAHDGNTI